MKNIFIGLAIGSILNTISGIIFTTGEVRLTILLYLLFSIIVGAASTVYEIERFSLLTKTLVQLFTAFISFIAIAYLANWFPFRWGALVVAAIFFFFIFFSVWTLFYLIEKKEFKRINQNIKK